MLAIRQATPADLGQNTEIYNDAIQKTTATFDTELKTLEEQEKWFANHDASHPVLIAEQDDLIVAWASLSQWSDRCAYNATAEIALYVKKEYRGKEIGKEQLGQEHLHRVEYLDWCHRSDRGTRPRLDHHLRVSRRRDVFSGRIHQVLHRQMHQEGFSRRVRG